MTLSEQRLSSKQAAIVHPGQPSVSRILQGTVVAVSADRKHRFSKAVQSEIRLVKDQGVEGDAHAGVFVRHRYLARRQPRMQNLRQVHLIPSELFEAVRLSGYDVCPGELGENITTAGLDLESMPLGTRIEFGGLAVIQLTGLRTPCILIGRFKMGLKDLLVSSEKTGPAFRCGVMAVVDVGGLVKAGDNARVLLPSGRGTALSAL